MLVYAKVDIPIVKKSLWKVKAVNIYFQDIRQQFN